MARLRANPAPMKVVAGGGESGHRVGVGCLAFSRLLDGNGDTQCSSIAVCSMGSPFGWLDRLDLQ